MIVTLLIIWLLPVLIIGICIYIDMEKGQSIEEYVKENGVNPYQSTLLIISPFVNGFVALCFIIVIIYSKIKHFRK